MLVQVRRFHRRASRFLRTTDDEDETTYGDFLHSEGFSEHFIAHYAVPVGFVRVVRRPGGRPWSTRRATSSASSSTTGCSGSLGSPQWYTVVGGSRTYVDRLSALLPDVRAGHAVTDVIRLSSGVQVRDVTGEVSWFDRVVIATHADQALGLLVNPTDDEVTTLKQFGYSSNVTVLHTDHSVLPQSSGARASWNYRMASCDRPDQTTVVTYWMNRLQGLESTQEFLVTLNDGERIGPDRVHAVMNYEHPIYTVESVRAQARLDLLATDQTVYAGAYHGWGFHETDAGPGSKRRGTSGSTGDGQRRRRAAEPACTGRRPRQPQPARPGPALVPAHRLPVARRPRRDP
jgi:predicted NAD/FAD-binding protein